LDPSRTGGQLDHDAGPACDEQLRARLVDRDPQVFDRIDRQVVAGCNASDHRPHDVQELGPSRHRDRHRGL
jgi:hypothetical protein